MSKPAAKTMKGSPWDRPARSRVPWAPRDTKLWAWAAGQWESGAMSPEDLERLVGCKPGRLREKVVQERHRQALLEKDHVERRLLRAMPAREHRA